MRQFPPSLALKEIIACAEKQGHAFPGIMNESDLQQSLGVLHQRIGAMEVIACGKLHEAVDGRERPKFRECQLRKINGVCGHPSFVIDHIRTALWLCMTHGNLPMKESPCATTKHATYPELDAAAQELNAILMAMDDDAASLLRRTALRHQRNQVMQRSQTDAIMTRIQEQERRIGKSDFLPLKSSTLHHLGMLILNE